MPLDLGIDNQLLEVPSVVEREEHENEYMTEFISPDWAH